MSEWTPIKLGSVVNITNGFAFKSKNFLTSLTSNALPVLKIKNVANGDVHLKDVQYHLIDSKYKKFMSSKGDILIALTGNHPQALTQVVGAVSKQKFDTLTYVNQRVAKIDPISELAFKDFIYYFLKDKSTHEYLASQSSGSANQANISKADIENVELLLPQVTEQKAIASVLSSLDDKIDLLHRQNKTLESMAETLFKQWFIEEAKETWTPATLKEEFDFVMGQSPSGSSFNEDGIGMPMYQGNADFGFRFPSNRVFTTEPTRFAEPFDTLISVRAPVGAQNMALEKCCIGRGLSAFRFKINPKFYTYTYFKFRQLMDEIKRFNDEGTVFGSISKSDFEKIQITIPPYDRIFSFEDIAKPINDKVINNCHQIAKLETLRNTLLPKLVSGAVRVQYAEQAIASVA
ncbi:restriction endonuclease subunit S [Enterobacteriaceae bacterium LUAb1]